MRTLCIVGLAAVIAGCASRPINERIDAVGPTQGYRTELRLTHRPDNDPRTIVLLAFSGGGTRAAAFSYGVLEALRDKEVVIDGKHRRLLDEVDVITGVSGGSFTALSYALFGDRLFAEYEDRFLKRDVQGALVTRVVNPFNWPKLIGGSYGRSELAADYYDEILFDGATFGDLLERRTPIAIVAGTDISTGARIEFSQTNFDLLCSDVHGVRLARAAAASSAVPIVLSPVTFNNYGGTCGFQPHAQVVEEASNPADVSRRAERALRRLREQRDLERSAERPFVHLVDGGISDNLGLRGVVEALELFETSPALRQLPGFDRLSRIAVIIVDAHATPRTDWDRSESPPGVIEQIVQSSGVPIDRYSYETIQLMKDIVDRWELQRELAIARLRLAGASKVDATARTQAVALYAIGISFEAVADAAERSYLMNLPTNFALPPDAIDRLRSAARRLLDASPQYLQFLQSLGERAGG
jgi:NTE family protein